MSWFVVYRLLGSSEILFLNIFLSYNDILFWQVLNFTVWTKFHARQDEMSES